MQMKGGIMKRNSFILVFVVGLCSTQGSSLPSPISTSVLEAIDPTSPRLGIYDGGKTTIEKHPYMAAMYREKRFACGGAIVGDSWVLVNAFCVDRRATPDMLDLYVGSTNASLGTHHTVEKIVRHPKFAPNNFDYSFALLNVKGKFKFSEKVKQIALPKDEVKAGTEVTISGWGYTKSDSQSVPLLQEAKMQVISLVDCAKKYQGYGIEFTNTMGCIYKEKGPTACIGDFGDPVTEGNVLRYVFLNIARDKACTDRALPSICANVVSVVPWIKKVIAEID